MPRTTWIGRHAEHRGLRIALEGHRLVTAYGAPGSGRSSSTARALREHQRAVGDALPLVRVDLAECASELDALSAIVMALGGSLCAPTSLSALSRHVRDLLASAGPFHLCFDQGDGVLDALSPRLCDWLANADGLRVTLTARAPLDIDGEAAVAILPLDESEVQALWMAQLLAHGARPSKRHALSKLTAAFRRPLSIALVAPAIASGAQIQSNGSSDDAANELAHAVRVALSGLSDRDRALLETIACAAPSSQETLLRELHAERSGQRTTNADRGPLQTLVQRALASTSSEALGPLTITMSPAVREQVLAVMTPARRTSLITSHAKYFAALARRAHASALGLGLAIARDTLRAAGPNLRLAVDRHLSNDAPLDAHDGLACQLAAGLVGDPMLELPLWPADVARLDRVERLPCSDREARAQLQLARSAVASRPRDAAAMPLREIVETLPPTAPLARLGQARRLAMLLEHPRRLSGLAAELARVARECDIGLRMQIERALAAYHVETGAPAAGASHAEAACELAANLDELEHAAARGWLAKALADLGQSGRALDALSGSFSVFDRYGADRDAARVYGAAGCAHLDLGMLSQADVAFDLAEQAHARAGSPAIEWRLAKLGRALCAWVAGRPSAARTRFEAGKRAATKDGDVDRATMLAGIAACLTDEGAWVAAEKTLAEAASDLPRASPAIARVVVGLAVGSRLGLIASSTAAETMRPIRQLGELRRLVEALDTPHAYDRLLKRELLLRLGRLAHLDPTQKSALIAQQAGAWMRPPDADEPVHLRDRPELAQLLTALVDAHELTPGEPVGHLGHAVHALRKAGLGSWLHQSARGAWLDARCVVHRVP